LHKDQFLGEQGERTLFVISCERAFNIQAYSLYKEEEVLFPPLACFSVDSIMSFEGGDFTMVSLQEVSPFEDLSNLTKVSANLEEGFGELFGSTAEPVSSQPIQTQVVPTLDAKQPENKTVLNLETKVATAVVTRAQLFPVFGHIILGKTLKDEMPKLGAIEKNKFYVLNSINFWYHTQPVVHHMYIVRNDALPSEWTKLGINMKLSYNEHISLWNQLFGNCKLIGSIHNEDFRGTPCFTAELETTCLEHGAKIVVTLAFKYEAGDADSKGTLYSMTLRGSLINS